MHLELCMVECHKFMSIIRIMIYSLTANRHFGLLDTILLLLTKIVTIYDDIIYNMSINIIYSFTR